jgi:hypothetical protein
MFSKPLQTSTILGPFYGLPTVTYIRELGSHLSNFIQFVIEEPFENLNHDYKRA